MNPIEHLPPDERERRLRPLLDHLADGEGGAGERKSGHTWQEWRVDSIGGGANNLLYRATGPEGDVAVKFTMRDGRDRAGHEFGALRALQERGLNLAPKALFLDRDRYGLPVVVQTWLPGESSDRLPEDEAAWRALVEHLVRTHGVTPRHVSVRLDPPTLDANTAAQAREHVRWQVARVPSEARPDALHALVRRLEDADEPTWPQAPLGLCRCDNNVRNFLRRPTGPHGAWASVDWEYSGWGDPAFDVAQWATHAAYTEAPLSHWKWALGIYVGRAAELGRDDPTLALRIQTYTRIMAVWWVARLVRYLYEIPAGLDPRLATWPADWEENVRYKYVHYVALAEQLYDHS